MRGGDVPQTISRRILVRCRIIGFALQSSVGMEAERVATPTMGIVSTQCDSVANTPLHVRPYSVRFLTCQYITVVGKKTESVNRFYCKMSPKTIDTSTVTVAVAVVMRDLCCLNIGNLREVTIMSWMLLTKAVMPAVHRLA